MELYIHPLLRYTNTKVYNKCSRILLKKCSIHIYVESEYLKEGINDDTYIGMTEQEFKIRFQEPQDVSE